jgi:AsmA-like C-terminal region
VRRGNFRFLDQSGNFVASFEGLQFHSTIRSGVDLRGNANVAKISLRDRFFLDGMRSTLHYDPTELDLSQIFSHAGGGDVTGRFVMQPQAEDSPFNASVRFRNVEADQIIAEAGGPKGVVRGKLEGNFEATGKIADPNALTGTGEILLRNGQLQQYSLLAALGQILQIEELTQLHLEQAGTKYHINSGVITVDELILQSPNVRLSAKGTIAFDGKLHLESQLAINDKIRNQLFKPIRANFEPLNESGYYAVDFEVSGTIDRPKSNLVEKVVGRDLKDFGSSVINSLLGGGKSERQRKKKSGDTSPTQSPFPSAAPSATQSEAASSPAASP